MSSYCCTSFVLHININTGHFSKFFCKFSCTLCRVPLTAIHILRKANNNKFCFLFLS